MTPQLREAIFNLPLCVSSSSLTKNKEGDIDHPSEFVKGKRRRLLFAIQKLFVLLSEVNERAISTQELTTAFGWEGNESLQQQDVQELNRVLFDVLEKALKTTPYEALIQELYTGSLMNQIACNECGNARGNEEAFLDLSIQVLGQKGVQESLKSYFEPEEFTGDNKIECDICGKKTDSKKGPKVTKLPPILTFSLNRYTMDYETFQRKKVNDRFEYPLELDMSPHVDFDPEYCQYELKAIIIHSGSAYGGHYHAYIHDELKEGNWHLTLPEEFKSEPTVIEKPKYDPTQYMTEEQIKKLEDEKNKNNPNQQSKKSKRQKKREQKEEEKKEIIYEYDECDFPIPYSDKRLALNWFDFNDSTVTPILPGKLQSQFGGSNESAYMLVYR